MKYTIQMELWIDSDEVYKDEVIKDFIEDELSASGSAVNVNNIKVISINN